MDFKNPVIICGAHGGGTSIVTKALRLNGFFAGEDSGDIRNKRDAKGGSGYTHESDAMVKINCTVLKSFLPHTNDTEMMQLSTWKFYLDVLKNPEAMATVFENLCGAGLRADRFHGGVNPSWGTVRLNESLEGFWGGEKKYSRPGGWKDPRNSATIPLWKLVFENPRMLFLERPEKENRKHNSPSGRWFCEEFRGELKEHYYNPRFLEDEDDVFSVYLEEMLKDLHTFNETMEWLGLKRLTIEEFKNLMKKADVKYEKL